MKIPGGFGSNGRFYLYLTGSLSANKVACDAEELLRPHGSFSYGGSHRPSRMQDETSANSSIYLESAHVSFSAGIADIQLNSS